jgi:hypothetical protein
MFTTDPITGLSYFRPGSLQPLYMFELFGLLVALAAYNGIAIPVSFPLALYKHLLDIPCTDLRDIQDGWPDIARSLQSIKDGAYEGLDYVFPLEANGLRMSINRSAIDHLRDQIDDYTSGKRTSLDLSVEEMSRIESGASAASTNPYQSSDHQWPGWSIHAPRSGSQPSVNDGSSTPESNTSQTEPESVISAAQADELPNMIAKLAKSDPNLTQLMKDIAARTTDEGKLNAFKNHVNRARAMLQAEKRQAKEKVATSEEGEEEEDDQAKATIPSPPSSPIEQDELTPSSIPSYISSYTLFLTTLSVLPQFHAFKRGFHTLLPPHILSPLTPRSLSSTLQGSPHLSLSALRRATQYKNFSANDPYIQSFWKVVGGWGEEKQKALLKFVTAAERVPVTGAGALTFRVQRSGGGAGGGRLERGREDGQGVEAGGFDDGQGDFEGGGDGDLHGESGGAGGDANGGWGLHGGAGAGRETRAGGGGGWGTETELLPTSSTCFGTLYLPRYKDEATLERKLGVALEFGGVGFGTA